MGRGVKVDDEIGTAMKRCSYCGLIKGLYEFHRNRCSKDGRSSSCKFCSGWRARLQRKADDGTLRDQQLAWAESHSEHIKQRKAEHRQSHREEICAYKRAKYAEEYAVNPAKYLAYSHNRRARLQGNGGTYTSGEWQALCEHYGNVCLRCHAATRLTVDHIVPISRGGTNDIGNLQPLCRHCNAAKSDKIINYRRHHDYLNGYDQDVTP